MEFFTMVDYYTVHYPEHLELIRKSNIRMSVLCTQCDDLLERLDSIVGCTTVQGRTRARWYCESCAYGDD